MGMLTAVGFGLSALQGISTHNQASADAEIANALQGINNQQVYESMLSTYKSLEVQADQVGEAHIANSIDQQKAEARAKGSATAASGASGTGGSGLDMQLQEASVEGSMNTARMQMNKDRQMESIKSSGADAVNVANLRFDRMPKQKSPNMLSTAMDIGMSGFRNTVSLQQLGGAWTKNFGGDGQGFSTESLIDSQPFNNSELPA